MARHKKHHQIKSRLSQGLSIREISSQLGVSSKTVQDVRSQYPDKFRPRPPAKPKPPGKIKTVFTLLRGSVPVNIYAWFKSEMVFRKFTAPQLLRFILSERYRGIDNKYIPGVECKCPASSWIKNCNSNHDRDEFICNLCGRVGEK